MRSALSLLVQSTLYNDGNMPPTADDLCDHNGADGCCATLETGACLPITPSTAFAEALNRSQYALRGGEQNHYTGKGKALAGCTCHAMEVP